MHRPLARFGVKIEAVLFLFVCAALIWIPLPGASNRYWSMMSWSAWVFILSALWFFAFAIGLVSISQRVKTAWPAILSLLLVQFWVFCQWFPDLGWTADRSASFYMLLLGLAYSCLFALLLQLLDRDRVKILLILIFVSVVVQALYGAMMVLTDLNMGFFIEKTYFPEQATGTFINPNHFSAYLNIGLSIGVAVLMTSTKKLSGKENLVGRSLQIMMSGSLAWRLALLVIVVAMVMSASRMGNLSFILALFVASAIYMILKRRLMWVWIALIASILIIDAVVIGARFGVEEIATRVAQTVVREEARASVTEAAWPMVSDYLWIGSGAGSFYSLFPIYQTESVGSDFYYHLHNDYLEFLIELGVVGVLPLFLFVCLSIRASVAAMTRQRSDWAQIAGYASMMSMIAIAVHSGADFSLRIPAYAATLMALLAAVHSSADGAAKRSGRRRSKSSKQEKAVRKGKA